MKFKKGDEVKIVRGKDRGKTGKIEKVLPKKNQVLITGVNMYKRHLKARSQREKSEIVNITKPLPVGSVMLICPSCHLTVKIGFSFSNGEKKRICKKCEQAI